MKELNVLQTVSRSVAKITLAQSDGEPKAEKIIKSGGGVYSDIKYTFKHAPSISPGDL